jgi:hypothetical protein
VGAGPVRFKEGEDEIRSWDSRYRYFTWLLGQSVMKFPINFQNVNSIKKISIYIPYSD